MLINDEPIPPDSAGTEPVPAAVCRYDQPSRPSKWGVLLALLLIAPVPSIGVWAAMIRWPADQGTAVGQATFFACKTWMFLLPAAWYLLVERQRMSWSPVRQGGLGVGALLGIAISAVIFAAYVIVGRGLIDADHVREMATQNGIGTPGVFLLGALYWITINSLLEEFAYRWFIFRQGERLLGGPAAVLLSAALFTVHHVIALKVQFDWTITVLASIGIFTGGAIWSWLYLRYRSIWPGYVSHAIVDVVVFGLGWWLIFSA